MTRQLASESIHDVEAEQRDVWRLQQIAAVLKTPRPVLRAVFFGTEARQQIGRQLQPRQHAHAGRHAGEAGEPDAPTIRRSGPLFLGETRHREHEARILRLDRHAGMQWPLPVHTAAQRAAGLGHRRRAGSPVHQTRAPKGRWHRCLRAPASGIPLCSAARSAAFQDVRHARFQGLLERRFHRHLPLLSRAAHDVQLATLRWSLRYACHHDEATRNRFEVSRRVARPPATTGMATLRCRDHRVKATARWRVVPPGQANVPPAPAARRASATGHRRTAAAYRPCRNGTVVHPPRRSA